MRTRRRAGEHKLGVFKQMSAQGTSTGFSVQEMGSIERFLTSRTVPLIYQTDENVGVHGTGTFFEHGGRPFLVTAGHVFNGIDPSNLGVPERAGKDVSVWHFGHAKIHHPRNTDEFDVAVVELQDRDFIALVKAGWRFLSTSNVAPPNPTTEQFIVAGYPNETVKNNAGVLTPSALMQLYTGSYDGEVRDGRGEFDLLLRYSPEAGNMFGMRKATPALGGVSGAAVYSVMPSTGALWAPESILKVAGIQVSFMHSKYVRAKTWALVSHVLSLVVNAGP